MHKYLVRYHVLGYGIFLVGGYRAFGTPNGFEAWIVYETRKWLMIEESGS